MSVLVRPGFVGRLAGAIYSTLGQTFIMPYGFSWDSATSSPAAVVGGPVAPQVTPTHQGMKRCLLLDNGTVNYYLDPTDSTKKADGTAADLSGADGQVMVEIPKFYTRRTVVGTIVTWEIAAGPLTGFTVHPAFVKDGVEVPYRYYSAYDGCVWTTGTTYQSGLNWDDNVGAGQNWNTATAKLASVSGIYPACGITRAEARTMAANRGAGWRQLDYTLFSAVQLLYLIEYQTFYSQNVLGAGNTNGTYLASSGLQTDSPHTIAGASNAWGNASTDGTQPSAGAKPGTAYMSYRGIENFFGNIWDWADGVIVNPDGAVGANAGAWWVTNNSADFSDSVRTNMVQVASNGATTNNYASALSATDNYFIATSVAGGSSTTYTTDYWYSSTAADRVVYVGGGANVGANAGAFYVVSVYGAAGVYRGFGARLAF